MWLNLLLSSCLQYTNIYSLALPTPSSLSIYPSPNPIQTNPDFRPRIDELSLAPSEFPIHLSSILTNDHKSSLFADSSTLDVDMFHSWLCAKLISGASKKIERVEAKEKKDEDQKDQKKKTDKEKRESKKDQKKKESRKDEEDEDKEEERLVEEERRYDRHLDTLALHRHFIEDLDPRDVPQLESYGGEDGPKVRHLAATTRRFWTFGGRRGPLPVEIDCTTLSWQPARLLADARMRLVDAAASEEFPGQRREAVRSAARRKRQRRRNERARRRGATGGATGGGGSSSSSSKRRPQLATAGENTDEDEAASTANKLPKRFHADLSYYSEDEIAQQSSKRRRLLPKIEEDESPGSDFAAGAERSSGAPPLRDLEIAKTFVTRFSDLITEDNVSTYVRAIIAGDYGPVDKMRIILKIRSVNGQTYSIIIPTRVQFS